MTDVLVAVDLQNDFIDGSLGSQDAQRIVEKAKERIQSFQGIVLFTRDTHSEDYLDTEEGKNLPVKHCIEGTKGWEIREELDRLRTTEPIDKPTFGSVELGRRLKEIDEKAAELGARKIILGAQYQAVPFYEKQGYRSCSGEYLDQGYPHYQMEKEMKSTQEGDY